MGRQLVRGDINLDLYAKAGTTPNILGETVLGMGVAIGEALDKARKKGDAVAKSDEEILATVTQGLEEFELGNEEEEAQALLDDAEQEADRLKNLPTESVTAPGKIGNVTYSYSMLGADAKRTFLQKNPGATPAQADAHAKKVVAEAKAYNVNKYGTQDPTGTVKGINNIVKVTKTDAGEYVTGSAIGKPEIETSTTFGSAGVAPKRLKNPPFQRTRQTYGRRQVSRGSLANVFGSSGTTSQTSYLVGNRGVPSDVISRGQQSQFQEGRTFVQKERRLSAPAWMGIGAAAIEGYNMGVDRRNYDAQVSADLQDYYTQEFSGLVAGRTGNDIFDNSVKELLTNKKKELAAVMQQREKYFAEGRGAEYTALIDELKKVPNELLSLVEGTKGFITNFDKDYEEDNIDFGAMTSEQTDEVMTVRRGGSVLGVTDMGGQVMLAGATRGEMPYLKSVKAMLADGKGPKYITKKNAFDYVNGVVDMIRKDPDKYSTTYQDANGVKVKRPMSFEELSPYLDRMFDAELDDNTTIRAYASKNNWDDDGMDAKDFNLAVNLSAEDDSRSPKNFVKAKFNEVARDLLAPYFNTTETTRLAKTIPEAGATGTGGKTTDLTTNPADYFAAYNQAVTPQAVTPSRAEGAVGFENTGRKDQEEIFFQSYPNIKQLGLAPTLQEPTVEDGNLIIRSASKSATTLGKDGGVSTRTSGGDVIGRIPITASPEEIATQLDLIIQSNKIAFPDNLPSTNFDAKQYINNYNQGK